MLTTFCFCYQHKKIFISNSKGEIQSYNLTDDIRISFENIEDLENLQKS